MPRGKMFTAEQITRKLSETEVALAQRKAVPEVVRKLGGQSREDIRHRRAQLCGVGRRQIRDEPLRLDALADGVEFRAAPWHQVWGRWRPSRIRGIPAEKASCAGRFS
jgi:hypothetical protein